MDPSILQILLLGVVQGAAELLPVSSSAHVIVAEKLMGLDPTRPALTFLLVMLHTGTMLAVILFFWKAWKKAFFRNRATLLTMVTTVGGATLVTIVLGLLLKKLIEGLFLGGAGQGQIEDLFGRLPLIGAALAVAGVVIIFTGRRTPPGDSRPITLQAALWIGASQGLCLPFRGLSRSGITISTGLAQGLPRQPVEEFSFALAVVITPPVVVQELHRLLSATARGDGTLDLVPLLGPGLLGMVAAFAAGLMALRLLSNWLEAGRWSWFGWYCLGFSALVFALAAAGV
ncbi:MAG: UDP-diphosphatase [Cyanobium sp. CACIAM 14]|nr:MAG: UDP-diphosphatase [Cyanobium sp. CACIAM 14]